MAILLAPNKWLHKSFGKYLFSGCDILAGILIHKLLVSTILPHARPRADTSHAPSSHFTSKYDERSPYHGHGYPNPDDDGKNVAPAPISEADARRATLLVTLHLLNPIVIGISTRGSSESVLTLLVLLTLFCALRGWWDRAAVVLGLCAHWKIYPVIYGVSCVGVIGVERQRGAEKKTKTTRARGAFSRIVGCIDVVVNAKTARFALISAGTFLVLGTLMYAV